MRVNRSRSERRFVPQCESLSDRILPAVTFSYNNATGVLVLTGNKKDDNIYINDPGNGALRVEASGMGVIFPTGVKSIQVFGKQGKDQVFYTLLGQLTNPMTITGDMSDGNDKLTIEFGGREMLFNFTVQISMGANDDKVFLNNIGQMAAGHAYNFNISGNGNGDQINANLLGNVLGNASFNLSGNQDLDKINFTANNDIDVRAGGRLSVRTDDDTQYNYVGEVDGLLELFLKGPSNEDTFSAQVNIQPDSNGIVGVVSGFVNGGSDEDKLTFKVFNNAGAFTTLSGLQIIGEGGKDKCTFTPNVAPFGCEKQTIG
jgi:hypothetical protein